MAEGSVQGQHRAGAKSPGGSARTTFGSGFYELRYTYDPDLTLGEADVVCTHEQLHDIAVAFAECAAPFKQILWVEDGEPDWLDKQEQAYVAAVCADLGFDLEEHDYGEDTT